MSAILLIGGLSGCSSTQQQNVWLRLRADRILTSQRSMRVRRLNPDVSVLWSGLVSGSGGTAVAVTLRNDTTTPVSDLPISVGVQSTGGRIYLNRTAGDDYFQTHIGALAANATATWVFVDPSPVTASGPLFADVGMPALTADRTPTNSVPQISAQLVSTSATSAKVRVQNNTSFPQYDLTVYASARSGSRLLAAGIAATPELDSGAATTLTIPLVGDPGSTPLTLQTPPTIID